MNKKLKKYSLKYDYLQLEKEDIETDFLECKKEFDELFSKYFVKEETQEVWVNEETGETRHTPPPIEEETEPNEEPELKETQPDHIKKLYKKLSIKTHPDKGGDKEHFQKISRAYKSNNLFELLYYAGNYDVEVDITPTDERVIEENISVMENEITHMKSTLIWAWGKGTIEDKKNVIAQLEKTTGKEISPDFELE